MLFTGAAQVSGHGVTYTTQFASGWSSPDFDGDTRTGQCSSVFSRVTQHYADCWYYSLGSGADGAGPDYTDGNWGPHMHTITATSIGLANNDGKNYTRLASIRRWARW